MEFGYEELLLIGALLFAGGEGRSARRRRRVWTRRLLVERPLRGEQKVLMAREKEIDAASFHAAYRMTPTTFDELLLLVGEHIKKQTTTFRDPVGVPERLGITLRYVETGLHTCGSSSVCLLLYAVVPDFRFNDNHS